MQLYSFFNSSTSYRVRIALALKGLDYQTLPVNLRQGEQRQAAHLRVNPMASVPVLVDGQGHNLGQSLAIIDYLDHLQPEPRLIPSEPLQRARVLEIALAIACDIHPLNNVRVLKYLDQVLGQDQDARKVWYAHWVDEGLRGVEALLRRQDGGPFCLGASPSIADCCLVPQVANALRMGCQLSAFPQVMRRYLHCQELPAFQAAQPQRQMDYVA
ncbi:maleylacetoacetate isomerase [Pseudomonas aeruginosa]|uniref:maleylacetoacetate isomerase n=1 Tax=Pseudomonas aeruginosa TaxID=287 RepID=UPI003FD261A4